MVKNNFALSLQQSYRGYMDTEIVVVSNDVDVNTLTIKVFNDTVEIDYSELVSGTITFRRKITTSCRAILTIGAASIDTQWGQTSIAAPGL